MKKKSNNNKHQKKKIIVTTLVVGAAGIMGYFGWQYYKKKKGEKNDKELETALRTSSETPTPSDDTTSVSYKPKPRPSVNNSTVQQKTEFPLKVGSKGEKVRVLQEALIAKYGKQIMPRYGADGYFGTETSNALKKLQLPLSIDQSLFNVLKQTGNSSGGNSLAIDLYNAAVKRDFNKTISLLKQIKSKQGYEEVSNEFKSYRINGGVRQTLVNGMLSSFSKEEQKQAIRFEFIRMGLQYDGSKWSLSGIDGLPIITNQPSVVWINSKESLSVPARMVLGNEVGKRLDYTLFENNGRNFLVHTSTISYL